MKTLSVLLFTVTLLLVSQINTTSISLKEVERLLDSFDNNEVKYAIIQDLFSLVFMNESQWKSLSPEYKVMDMEKIQMLEYQSFLGGSKYKRMESLLSITQISNSSKCVPCSTLRNILQIMCDQHYAIQPGTCVECDFLGTVIDIMCIMNCTHTNVTMLIEATPKGKHPITITVVEPCVFCKQYFLAIELFCGPPNCTEGPYYMVSPLHSDVQLSSSKRSSPDPVNCIPCYFQYLAYQLLCEDLFDHCALIPTPLPSHSTSSSMTPSSTPPPSSSMTPSASSPPSSTMTASSSVSPLPSYYYYDDDDDDEYSITTSTTDTTTTTTSSTTTTSTYTDEDLKVINVY